jgi:hypothetical protein
MNNSILLEKIEDIIYHMHTLEKEDDGSWSIWFKNRKKIKKIKINQQRIRSLRAIRRCVQDILARYNIQ